MLNIGVYANSSLALGEGHAIRCINLIKKFNSENIIWFKKTATNRVEEIIGDLNIKIVSINEFSEINFDLLDLLIIDDYRFAFEEITRRGRFNTKVVCIDDLVDRNISADMVINSNPVKSLYDYGNKLPEKCIKLFGEKYILLSDEFENVGEILKKDNLMHIFFGSTDGSGLTYKYLKSLLGKLSYFYFNVVVTRHTEKLKELKELSMQHDNVNLFYEPETIMESLRLCRYSIGSPGTATWERLVMKCECLLLSLVDNQIEILKALDEQGYVHYIGDSSDIDCQVDRIVEFIKAPVFLEKKNDFDGLGTSRVYQKIVDLVGNTDE